MSVTATMCTLSTHVLDLESGMPAKGMTVELGNDTSQQRFRGITDSDGRIRSWMPDAVLSPGTWSLTFHSGDWYSGRGEKNFHPLICVRFLVEERRVEESRPHLHVPLLLNRFGYSTYRGS